MRCGYNLRGLDGDPLRCPECSHANARVELFGRAAQVRRLRELQGAGDAFLLAAVSLVGGVALWHFNGLLPLAAPLLALGALLLYNATAVARRIGRGVESWGHAWTRYLTLTLALPALPAALWLLCSILVWCIRAAVSQTTGLDFIDALFALPLALVLAFVIRPLRRLRRRQRLAFARLMRLVRVDVRRPARPSPS